jgi:hypothetical protein
VNGVAFEYNNITLSCSIYFADQLVVKESCSDNYVIGWEPNYPPYPNMCIDANFTNANRGRCVLGDDPFEIVYSTSVGDCCQQADQFNATTYQFNETSGQCALYAGSFVGTECGQDIITSSMGNIVPLKCSNYTIH